MLRVLFLVLRRLLCGRPIDRVTCFARSSLSCVFRGQITRKSPVLHLNSKANKHACTRKKCVKASQGRNNRECQFSLQKVEVVIGVKAED